MIDEIKKLEKKPLLNTNEYANYMSANGSNNSHISINNSDSSNTESIIDSNSTVINLKTDWIDSVDRYGGKTQKRKDTNNNWEYKTKFETGKIIQENFKIINNKKHWMKEIIENNKITLELLSINNNKLVSFYKIFESIEKYIKFLPVTSEKINQFQLKKSNLSNEDKFLESITIKTIDNINDFIKNTNLFNKQLKRFKEKPNNRDLNILLKLYKYLTVSQNFVDSSKPIVDRSINTFFKKALTTATNLTLGLLQIYIGLTGKNLQRVISNYPIDGNEHTSQDYIDAIFLNWENYLMVLVDTALATFLTSAASSWSRDVIFNKQNKIKSLEIKQLNIDDFEKYKDIFEALLYEENHQELMKYFSKLLAINDLMQKFNEIENSAEFQYHPNYLKEIETIKQISNLNNVDTNTNIDIKKVITSANKTIKGFEKSSVLANNWGRNILVNLALETLTWGTSHVILTGSSENMSKENFNIQDWITKDIFTRGVLIANISRYFFMRPINNIFKSGLSKWGIPTNICPKKFSKWINKQSRAKKLMMAIPLFLAVTFTVNAVKAEAALTTEHGIEKATELFYEKFFRLTTLGFSIGVTMIDMIAFAISDFYQNVFNQSISIKTLTSVFTKCCVFNKTEIALLEDNLAKLDINGKLPKFDEEFKKYQKKTFFDKNLVNSIDIQNQPSTSTRIYHSI